MAWRKHSIKRISSYSRNFFYQISETRMRSSVNVFGPTKPQFELRQAIRLLLWYTGIPLEIQMPSLRVALMTRMTKEDNDQLRLQELEALDEK